MPVGMTESQMVYLIADFFKENKKVLKTVEKEELLSLIRYAFSYEPRISPQDRSNLTKAIELQVSAYQYALSKKGQGLEDTLYQFIPENHELKNPPGSLKEFEWTTTNTLLTIVGFPIAAVSFAAADLIESADELFNNQRVVANLATLCLSAAYVLGAVAIVCAIAPVTPVGWAVCTLVALTVAAALITKGVRILANSIDASLSSDSASQKDSRFQLTTKDELHLLKQGWDKEEFPKIKALIRGLAIDANSEQQYGLYSTPKAYSKIINLLQEVKKGEISEALCEQYKINRPPEEESLKPRE